MMNVEVLQDECVLVRVSGEVELPNVDKFRDAISEAIKLSASGFVIDMTGVNYVDSAGISSLVYAYRSVCPQGGKLAVVVADKNVKRIITLTRLDTLPGISLQDDIAAAKQALVCEPSDTRVKE